MRIVLLLPMGYALWRTRDIRIGIVVHVALTGLGFATNAAPALLAGRHLLAGGQRSRRRLDHTGSRG